MTRRALLIASVLACAGTASAQVYDGGYHPTAKTQFANNPTEFYSWAQWGVPPEQKITAPEYNTIINYLDDIRMSEVKKPCPFVVYRSDGGPIFQVDCDFSINYNVYDPNNLWGVEPDGEGFFNGISTAVSFPDGGGQHSASNMGSIDVTPSPGYNSIVLQSDPGGRIVLDRAQSTLVEFFSSGALITTPTTFQGQSGVLPGTTLPTCSSTIEGNLVTKVRNGATPTKTCVCVNTAGSFSWASVTWAAGALSLVTAGGSSTVCP